MCRRSSGAERALGKGEAGSSILLGGTTLSSYFSYSYGKTPSISKILEIIKRIFNVSMNIIILQNELWVIEMRKSYFLTTLIVFVLMLASFPSKTRAQGFFQNLAGQFKGSSKAQQTNQSKDSKKKKN